MKIVESFFSLLYYDKQMKNRVYTVRKYKSKFTKRGIVCPKM
ncbi:Uncharacterised protein [uncultured Clostridium sp.]|jgi:hypothetical protein|nr:Uncharacterised protein [uncultured Clostridium sp.]